MRTPRILAVAALAALTLHLAACKKVGKETPVENLTTVPAPADLLVVASLPRLEGGLAGVGAYADKVQPGISGMIETQVKTLLAGAIGLTSLDGARGDAPVRLLVLEPETKGRRNALLVGVADEKKLRESAKNGAIQIKNGLALVGDKLAVEALAGYAFSTLAKSAAPDAPVGVVYAPALLATYKDDILEARDMMKTMMASGAGGAGGAGMGKIVDVYYDGAIGLLERSESIEVRIESSADIAGLDIAFVPRKDSDLAAFVAAQKPAGRELLARLPARTGPPSLVLVGHVELGPLRDKLRPLIQDLTAQMLGMPLDAETRAAFDAWFDEFNGEIAAVGDMDAGGMRFTQLVGVKSGDQAMVGARALFEKLFAGGPRTTEVMGIKTTISGRLDAGAYQGIKFLAYDSKVDLSSLPAELPEAQLKMYGSGLHTTVGGWDDVLGVALGPDSEKLMPALVDASRGKAPRLELTAGTAKLLDDSIARGESLSYVMNLGGIVAAMAPGGGAATPPAPSSSGLVFALGFQGGRAHIRFALPAEHLLEIKNAIAAGGAGAPPQ